MTKWSIYLEKLRLFGEITTYRRVNKAEMLSRTIEQLECFLEVSELYFYNRR